MAAVMMSQLWSEAVGSKLDLALFDFLSKYLQIYEGVRGEDEEHEKIDLFQLERWPEAVNYKYFLPNRIRMM